MHIFGYPIKVNQIKYIARDQLRLIKHSTKKPSETRIHFIYFSYTNDFSLLSMSLESLTTFNHEVIASVNIIEDCKGPFTEVQKNSLRKTHPSVEFIQLGNIDWASIDTLNTELKAFNLISSKANETDFIAKLDSDILFFESNRLIDICNSGYDFIGDGHYSSYLYAQGGLYFIRATLALLLYKSLKGGDLADAINECQTNAEDQVISSLIAKRTKNIWLARLMLFPNEYEKTNLENNLVKREFCAVHFVHKKIDMAKIFKKLMRKLPQSIENI